MSLQWVDVLYGQEPAPHSDLAGTTPGPPTWISQNPDHCHHRLLGLQRLLQHPGPSPAQEFWCGNRDNLRGRAARSDEDPSIPPTAQNPSADFQGLSGLALSGHASRFVTLLDLDLYLLRRPLCLFGLSTSLPASGRLFDFGAPSRVPWKRQGLPPPPSSEAPPIRLDDSGFVPEHIKAR
ncbi:hypothetical protein ACCO45_001474 [Purpureocillium lilacinum]|uniref:Uncharacterized protein n=1 Tax=Purpureocillium lilacinum TaxID=33203 RepID=A0ACC4E734_PURLI